MLIIVRKFELAARFDYGTKIEKILDEFGVNYRHVDFHSAKIGNREFVRVHFHECTVPDDRFAGLIERLNGLPMQAGARLTY